ncbi:hypothetical protein J2Y67_001231 [Neobacillus niacini]|nr:hypothetical protein [Neobacillus niacini]
MNEKAFAGRHGKGFSVFYGAKYCGLLCKMFYKAILRTEG